MAKGGFGLVCKIDPGTGLTAIVGITDADFPRFRKFLAESTAHDSPQGYMEKTSTGKRALEPFSITINWDIAEATHTAVRAAFDSDDPVSFSIEDPHGGEVIAFSAHISEVGRISRQEEQYQCEVLVEPTGAPTIT